MGELIDLHAARVARHRNQLGIHVENNEYVYHNRLMEKEATRILDFTHVKGDSGALVTGPGLPPEGLRITDADKKNIFNDFDLYELIWLSIAWQESAYLRTT